MKQKNSLFIGIILIIVVGIAIVWMFWSNRNKEISTTQEQQAIEPVTTTGPTAEATVLEKVLEDPNTQTIVLSAVDGSSSSGTAYRLIEDGRLLHAVIASMPEPAQGNVYEGWLMQSSSVRFIPTGVLEQNEKGEWVLEFAPQEVPTFATEGFLAYIEAIITEETVLDNIPETHILEGKF